MSSEEEKFLLKREKFPKKMFKLAVFALLVLVGTSVAANDNKTLKCK